MRTRSRTKQLLEVPWTRITSNYTPTSQSGMYGGRAVLPMKATTTTRIQVLPAVAGLPFFDTEIISDEVGPSSSVHECSHTKRKGVEPQVDIRASSWVPVYDGYNGSQVQMRTQTVEEPYPLYDAVRTLNSMYLNIENPQTILPSQTVGWSSFPDKLAQVPAKVLSKFEDLHLSTTLIESRELPKLYKMFKGRSSIPSLLSAGGSALRGYLTHGVRSNVKLGMAKLSKASREGILGTQFGILPTVRDALDISREIATRDRKKWFEYSVSVKQEGKFDHPPFPSTTGSLGVAYAITGQQARRWYRVDGAKVKAKRREYNSSFFTEADEFLSRYVGNNPLGLIWEVLPLSFALDWILSVDDMLDSLWLANTASFDIQYWSTTKTEITRTGMYKVLEDVHGTYPALFGRYTDRAFKCSYSHYNRVRRDSPNPLLAMRAKGATTGNLFLSLLIAMGLQRG